MFNIIPVILILISLSIIIIIIVKKFSVLTNLDVDNMQSEKEAKFKEKMVGNKLKRNFYKYFNVVLKIIKPSYAFLKDFLNKFYKKLINYKEEKEKKILQVKDTLDEKEIIEKLFFEYSEFFKNNKLEEAEKILIKIIGIDSQNIDAFRKLGKLYLDRKNYQEAEQSLLHTFKLVENNLIENPIGKSKEENLHCNDLIAEISFDLSFLYKETNDIKKALKNIEKSLLVEPNNPRYLDIKFELSILDKDKDLSLSTYKKLKEVNPDNKKLEEFKKRIEEL